MQLVVSFLLLAAVGIALLNGGTGSSGNENAPSCGGDQAVCSTGSYNLEGKTVSNCITCKSVDVSTTPLHYQAYETPC